MENIENTKTAILDRVIWECEFLGLPGYEMTREPRWFRMMLRRQKRDRMLARVRKIMPIGAGFILLWIVTFILCIIYGV